MAKKNQIEIRPYCRYCIHSVEIGNYMIECDLSKFPKPVGWMCDIKKFKLNKDKYNE